MSVPLLAFPDIISALIMVGNLQVNIFSPLLIEIVVAFFRWGRLFHICYKLPVTCTKCFLEPYYILARLLFLSLRFLGPAYYPKTCNLFCSISAKRVDELCCARFITRESNLSCSKSGCCTCKNLLQIIISRCTLAKKSLHFARFIGLRENFSYSNLNVTLV